MQARARDLFYALWIPDLFMQRVEANGDWSLFCPNEAPGLAEVGLWQALCSVPLHSAAHSGGRTCLDESCSLAASETWSAAGLGPA